MHLQRFVSVVASASVVFAFADASQAVADGVFVIAAAVFAFADGGGVKESLAKKLGKTVWSSNFSLLPRNEGQTKV